MQKSINIEGLLILNHPTLQCAVIKFCNCLKDFVVFWILSYANKSVVFIFSYLFSMISKNLYLYHSTASLKINLSISSFSKHPLSEYQNVDHIFKDEILFLILFHFLKWIYRNFLSGMFIIFIILSKFVEIESIGKWALPLHLCYLIYLFM